MDACIRSEYERHASSITIFHTTTQSFCKAGKRFTSKFAATGSSEGPSSLNAKTYQSVLMVLLSCLSIPKLLYTIRNEKLVALRRKRLESAGIGVKCGSLLVSRVGRLSLIIFTFIVDVELISLSALVVKILCFLGEF